MSIASAITNAQNKVAAAYTSVNTMGGTLPATQNLSNLPTAISSIPTGGSPVISSLSITPTTSQQTITAPSGTDGYSPITVGAVTSSIDANITAGNIKSGVSILGVTGNYGGGGSKYGCTIDNLLGDVNANGVLQAPTAPSGDLVFTGVKDLAANTLNYKFYYINMSGKSVSFPDLEELSGGNAMYYAFYNCLLSSVSIPKLKTVSGISVAQFAFALNLMTAFEAPELETVSGLNGLRQFIYYCQYLVTASFPKLKMVSGNFGIASLVSYCLALTTFSLPELTTANGTSALYGCCSSCGNIETVYLPKLSDISGQNTFNTAFQSCPKLQHIYFNGLTTTSFGSYVNQFNNMFNSQTGSTATGGCTVHFPSNLQSTIAGLTGYPTFGGSSSYINLAFDLPATS